MSKLSMGPVVGSGPIIIGQAAALLAGRLVHDAAGADDLGQATTGNPEGLAPRAGGMGDVPQ